MKMSKSTNYNLLKFITMKNLILVCLLLASVSVNAQVGIGIAVPDASSQLDVTSANKGVLIPRMLATARTSIASPATGLLVYQTDGTPGFYYNSGTPASPAWVLIQNSANVTTQGNTFNGASQLVQLNGSTQLPAVSGANLTNLNAGNLSSGTVNTARLGSGTADNTTFLRGDGTWAAAGGGANMSVLTVSSNTTLSNANQFVYITGTVTITLPATPATGQIIYLYTDSPNAAINPNGKVFRQANADYGTSKFNEFGNAATSSVMLFYNGTKWFPISIG